MELLILIFLTSLTFKNFTQTNSFNSADYIHNEELVYSVSWTIFRLGTIIIKTEKSRDRNNLNEKKIIHEIENSNVVDYFTNTWNKKYQTIKKIKNSIESVDMDKYLGGLETLIKLHLASEGFK